MSETASTARTRHDYDAYAERYDRETDWYDRVMLGDGRAWACSKSHGRVLEVAIGTGRNLQFYPPGIKLTGVDLSGGMLAHARRRAKTLDRQVALVHADAQTLPFACASFDTVMCTLGLSSIPDDAAAVAEMHRVLRSGGHVVLLGHVASPHRMARGAQRLVERVAATRTTDRQTRRVVPLVQATGFVLSHLEHSRGGIIERVIAVKS